MLSRQVERDGHSTPSEIVYHPFPEVSLEAKSAYIYDMRTGEEIYALEADKRLPLASITKLMSSLVAYELSPQTGLVTITEKSLEPYGDSGLRVGERWSLRNLLDFSLVSSSNDGMRAVALSLAGVGKVVSTDEEALRSFVEAMNRKASQLDLSNTYFWNETGLDESEVKGGGYGSARDTANLLAHILSNYPDLLEATRSEDLAVLSNNTLHLARNTNILVNEIPGILASKTGYTDIAGGNLVFAFDPELGRPIIISILGSSAEGRFQDARKLVSATLKYIQQ